MLTPTEEPAFAGFTNTGKLRRAAILLRIFSPSAKIAVGVEPQVVRLLDVRGGKQRVGDGFIHAHSGSQCAAADIRDAAELKETLNGAVFAVFAVQHGKRTSTFKTV